jgi:hypothetical protein
MKEKTIKLVSWEDNPEENNIFVAAGISEEKHKELITLLQETIDGVEDKNPTSIAAAIYKKIREAGDEIMIRFVILEMVAEKVKGRMQELESNPLAALMAALGE